MGESPERRLVESIVVFCFRPRFIIDVRWQCKAEFEHEADIWRLSVYTTCMASTMSPGMAATPKTTINPSDEQTAERPLTSSPRIRQCSVAFFRNILSNDRRYPNSRPQCVHRIYSHCRLFTPCRQVRPARTSDVSPFAFQPLELRKIVETKDFAKLKDTVGMMAVIFHDQIHY
jgi:hypothetical protein